jgi:hypothetical protein
MIRSEVLLNEALEIKRVLIQFLRHPMSEIKNTPDWEWPRVFILMAAVTSITGFLGGVIEQRFLWAFFSGIFLSPLLATVMLGVSTLFFYYSFQIFAEKTVSIRQLFTLILFANIPQFIFQMISGIFPPVTLVGMALTALLLLVGFVETFQMDRKLVIRLIGGLYALFFTLWLWDRISSTQLEKKWGFERSQAPAVELGK